MNDFKKRLEIIENIKRKPNNLDRKKEIDNKIGDSIAKMLFDMSQNCDDKDERTQILDRMLSINKLFTNGFDEEINFLQEAKEHKNENEAKVK